MVGYPRLVVLNLKSYLNYKKPFKEKKIKEEVLRFLPWSFSVFAPFWGPVWALVFTFEQAFGLRLCAFLESGPLLQDVLPSGATLWTMWMGFLHVVLPPCTSFLGRRCHPQGPVRQHLWIMRMGVSRVVLPSGARFLGGNVP